MLTREEEDQFKRLLEKEEEYRRNTLIASYYPPFGPLAREHYPKHLKFFALGKEYRERMFMAGNRCITRWTVIETDRGERQLYEVLGERGFGVKSWDGSSRCTRQSSGAFLKSIEPAFRIHLGNGEAFEATGKHQVYARADSAGRPPWVWRMLGQLIRASDVLHCLRTTQGWKASYDTGRYRDDGSPLPTIAADECRLPRRGDAPNSSPYDWNADEVASRFERNHAYQDDGHHSIADAEDPAADRSGRTVSPVDLPHALPSISISQIVEQFACGLTLAEATQAIEQLLDGMPPTPSRYILVALRPPVLFPARKIVAIEPLGHQPIFDMTVEETHSYFAAGCLHHNTGKTMGVGAYETTLHATGRYEDYAPWWTGKRFDRPISCIAAGDTNLTTRDILQTKLFGKLIRNPGDSLSEAVGIGTGMVPADAIVRATPRRGAENSYEEVTVRHVSGGTSVIKLRSFEQGAEAFQGTEEDWVWLDENFPQAVYSECITRLMTTEGHIIMTFTPINGVTPVIRDFMEKAHRA